MLGKQARGVGRSDGTMAAFFAASTSIIIFFIAGF